MKALTASCLLALAITLPLGVSAQERVFEAKLSLGAVAQGDGVIEKAKISGDALLNVARDRSPDAEVPADEVLAFVLDCADLETTRLSVVDLSSVPTELVTLADAGAVDVVLGATSGAVVAEMDVTTTAGVNNSLDGGHVVVAGTFKFGPGGCPSGLKASLSGAIDVTITDDVGTDSLTVLVLKGKIGAGKEPIATLP